jgi:hypothetical protein
MSNMVIPADTVISNARRAVQGASESLRYPEEVGAHSIIFNFKDYEARQNGAGATNISSQVGGGSICLPLPRGIQENTAIDVMAEKLGILGSGARDLYNTMKGGADFNDLGKMMAQGVGKSITGASQDSITEFALFASRAGLNFMSPAIEGGLAAASGTAINPHQALVFSGVGIRQYQFEWTLVPDNEKEADAIRNIVKTFKKKSLPAYKAVLGQSTSGFESTLSRGLLKYPSMVDVFFTGLDTRHFPLFKTAMVSQIQVDYTPHGNFVLNKGQTGSKPSMVNLVVNIIEADIHTADDYSSEQ